MSDKYELIPSRIEIRCTYSSDLVAVVDDSDLESSSVEICTEVSAEDWTDLSAAILAALQLLQNK